MRGLFSPPSWPRWAVMWAIAMSIYATCKWLTWRQADAGHVPLWKHVAYLVAWPGMDASAFLTAPATTPSSSEWLAGAWRLALGAACFFGVARLGYPDHPYVAGWIGMVGLVLMLHFGAFQVLSCAWRRVGVDARPLMDRPLHAVSLSDFWSRRWNTAFRDLTHRLLFRPLTSVVGVRGALVSGFLVSGVVHDVVISVPAGAGYGGPTAFFALQSGALLFERSAAGRGIGLGQGWRGWSFTMLALVVPVYWLFHPTFVETVIVPFMRAVRAL